MTLFRQITGLITIFLLAMSGIILWFILNYNKSLIEEQINANAKNSANFLGLSISQNVELNDIATIEGMMTSIIDNGFYEYIKVLDINEKEIVSIDGVIESKKAPSWFSSLFLIQTPSLSAEIMKGWQKSGSIEVKISQNSANNQMWKAFLSLSQIFITGIIFLLIIIYFFLNRLLKPLKKLSLQAKAIDNNEFLIEEDLPQTIEFKNVVVAMNKTISKMEKVFNTEVETLKKYNEIYYKDKDTGLGNRNFLMLKLNTYLKNSHGLLLFFTIKDEISFKKQVGYVEYKLFKDFVINSLNEELKFDRDLVLSKLDDGTIAALLPNIHYDEIDEKFKLITIMINDFIEEKKYREDKLLEYSFGLTSYNQNSSIKDLLTRADKATIKALKKEEKFLYLEDEIKFTKNQWKVILVKAFENDSITFVHQNILDATKSKLLMKEYFLRIEDEDGNTHTPGDFLSVVHNLGLMAKLEKIVYSKIFDFLLKHKKDEKTVVNISYNFIENDENVNWLISYLKTEFVNNKSTIYFECINADVLSNLEKFKEFTSKIYAVNHKVAIESFTFDYEDLEYLKVIKPEYIKISKSYILGEQDNSSILKNITSTLGASLIIKHVETKDEYNELINKGFFYLQGRYIDKIEVV